MTHELAYFYLEKRKSQINSTITRKQATESLKKMILAMELNNSACTLIFQDSIVKAIEQLNKALQSIEETPETCKQAISTSSCQHRNGDYRFSTTDLSLCHYYPTLDLDEGMNTFSQPLTLSCGDFMLHCECRLTQATVFFNLGIAHSRMKEENKALNYFQKCFDKIHSFSAHSDLGCERFGMSRMQRSVVNAVLHNIGHSHFKLGNFDDAISSYRHAINAISTTCTASNCNFHTLEMSSAMNCLAVARYHRAVRTKNTANKLAETKSIIKTLLEALQWAGCCKNRESATMINNLARVKFFCEEYKEALALYKQACMLRVLNIGESHMDVAACHFNMGQAEEKLGEIPQAVESYKKFLSIVLSEVGPGHPEVSIVFLNIGQLSYDLKNLQEARNFLSQAVKYAKLCHGPNHIMVATASNKLGNVLYDQCEFDLALGAYQAGLAIERLLYPLCHENSTITLLNIARVLEKKQEYKEALEIYSEVLSSKWQKQDEEGASNVLTKIGSLHDFLGEYALASRAFRKAADIQRISQNCQQSLLPTILNALGIVLYKEGLFHSALSSFAEAMEIHDSSNCLCPTEILRNTATVYKSIGDTKKALQFYKKSLLVEQSINQGTENVMEVATLYHQIGMLLQESGDAEEACQFLKNSFQMCLDHPNNIGRAHAFTIVKDLGYLYVLMGDIEAAFETYSVAMTTFQPTDMESNHEEFTMDLPIEIYLLLSRKISPAAAAA